jgi:hypothetical protein
MLSHRFATVSANVTAMLAGLHLPVNLLDREAANTVGQYLKEEKVLDDFLLIII